MVKVGFDKWILRDQTGTFVILAWTSPIFLMVVGGSASNAEKSAVLVAGIPDISGAF